MGPDCVVVLPPGFDHGLGFLERVKDLAIEQLVPQPGVEAFAIAILPWAAGLNVGEGQRRLPRGGVDRNLRAENSASILRNICGKYDCRTRRLYVTIVAKGAANDDLHPHSNRLAQIPLKP